LHRRHGSAESRRRWTRRSPDAAGAAWPATPSTRPTTTTSAGLSWITILRKREAFRAAFDDFDPEKVARYGEADRVRLLADAGIIRSNAKIDAAIEGARLFLDLREKGEDFAAFCWDFVDGQPIQNAWDVVGQVPAQTPLAVEVSKALKAKGFKFVGPVIVYAWMQAVGLVNDHLTSCFRHAPIRAMSG
jgi:DNA-3-methyladenine glycosylase I